MSEEEARDPKPVPNLDGEWGPVEYEACIGRLEAENAQLKKVIEIDEFGRPAIEIRDKEIAALREALGEAIEYFDECEGFADDVQSQSDYRNLTGNWVDKAVKDFKNVLASARKVLGTALDVA